MKHGQKDVILPGLADTMLAIVGSKPIQSIQQRIRMDIQRFSNFIFQERDSRNYSHMESSINCEQNGNGIWLDLFIWLTRPEHNTELEPHTTLGAGEITKLKERRPGMKGFC